MRGRRRTWAARALTAAAVLYNGWFLELPLPTGLDVRHSYVSELYAADQPYQALFGGIEAGCAFLVIAGALLARDLLPGPLARTGCWALAGFGASSLGDVLLPMRCAPSLEPGCAAVHPAHTLTSALVHFFLFASMTTLCAAAASAPVRMPAVRRWGPRVAACALVSALSTVGPLVGHPGWHGLPQRLHLLMVGAWFALLAGALSTRVSTGTDTGTGARTGPGTGTTGGSGSDPDAVNPRPVRAIGPRRKAEELQAHRTP